METRCLLSTVCVCAVLAGCASVPGPTTMGVGSKDDPCRGNAGAICKIVVTVGGCDPSQITVDNEKVYVAAGTTPNMQWTVDPRSWAWGWEFATDRSTGKDGIVFKTDAAKRELVLRGQSTRVITFTNSGATGEYEYGINIVKRGNAPGIIERECRQKDPWVVNF